MNYVTTNVRLPEHDYLKLKEEAARERKSLAQVIRDRISPEGRPNSEKEITAFMSQINENAFRLGKKLKNFDAVKTLREIRYEGK